MSEKRVIKFRGFTENKWIYGFFFETEQGCYVGEYNDEVSVFPKSVGQYTGLKDVNGKEIYEGDIIDLKYPLSTRDEEDFDDYKMIRVAINFQSGSFWFTGDGFTDCNWHFYNSEDRKVIGNIFETPELLVGV